MKNLKLSAVLAATLVITSYLLIAPAANAQTSSPAAPIANIPASDALYQSFGAQPGLMKLMDHFVTGLLKDTRISEFFNQTDQVRLKAQLVSQFCQVSGGPCTYSGGSMSGVHKNMGVNKAAFNALVEVLQVSMDAQGIPFSAQNQMLAKLAPMHRDIIAK